MINKIVHKIRSAATDFEVSILKSRARHYGYEVKSKEPITVSEIVIENYFKTGYQKNALLSYIVYPFIDKINISHSNYVECYMIAEVLNELGYNVDIINWNNERFVPLKDYHLVIDNHNHLERFHSFLSKKTLKIFHATNAHWLYQNKMEFERHYQFYLSTGVALTPTRLLSPGNSVAYCDAISMLGNGFTKMTFGKYESKVHRIPISVTTLPDPMKAPAKDESRYNFLWFNSAGFLLKGLDMVLDAFIKMPQYRLFVCGNFEREADFINYYADRLKDCDNIKMTGWVDVESDRFAELTRNCTWVINTSFSEGGGGSTLNCMAKGLIPIVSRSASIDVINNETGFYLEENSEEGLSSLIFDLVHLPQEIIQRCSENVARNTILLHSKENFKKTYKSFLKGLTENAAA